MALGRTIEQAQAALTAIVDGARVELAGVQLRCRPEADLRAEQLDFVAQQSQSKFGVVEAQVAQVIEGAQGRFVAVEGW